MSPSNKPKVTVKIYYHFHPTEGGPGRLSQAQIKKYFSLKPLRRPPPRKTP